MKRFILFILLIPIYAVLFAQPSAPYNKYDSEGRRTGPWMWTDGDFVECVVYKEGNKDGLGFRANKVAKELETFFYDNGSLRATRLYINAVLIGQTFDYEDVERFVPCKETGAMVKFDRQCYSQEFYPNGMIKDEGLWIGWKNDSYDDLFTEDFGEGDFFGEWHYYDEEGNLTETKVYETTIYHRTPSEAALFTDEEMM